MALILRTPEQDRVFTERVRENIPRPASPILGPSRLLFQRRLQFPTLEEIIENGEPALIAPVSPPVELIGQPLTPGGPLSCVGPRGGEVLTFSLTAGAGTSNVEQSSPLPFRFIISHIHLSFEATAAQAANWGGFLAEDSSLLVADVDTWRPVLSSLGSGGAIENAGDQDKLDFYPNIIVLERNFRLKNLIQNTAAGVVSITAIWDLLPLD